MKTLLRISFLLVLSLSFYCAYAQGTLDAGYIITATGHDTIRGVIDNKNWNLNPKEIAFIGPDAQKRKFGVNDIVEFAVKSDKTTEIYRRKVLDIDKGDFELKDLKDYPSPKISRDTVFATLYESGRINLYYLRDETNRMHYLVEKDDTGIQDLGIEKYIDGQTQTVQTRDIYKNQLSRLMSDCPGIITKIGDVPFREKELRRLTVYYNQCIDGNKKPKYSKANEKVDFFVGALVGGGFRTDKVSGISDFQSKINLGPSPNLDVAIALGVILPRTNKHLELGLELGWGYYTDKGSAYESTYGGHNTIQVVMAPQMIKGNLLLRYLVSVRKVRLAFSGGLSMGGILSAGSNYNETVTFFCVSSQVANIIAPSSWQAALILGAGIRIKDVNIEMRYFLNTSLPNDSFVDNFSNSLNLTIYYAFFNSERKQKKAK